MVGELSTAEQGLPADVRRHYPFTGRMFTLPSGLHLHYLDEGQGDPVLFVHGNPTWSFYWRKLVTEFSATNRCIAVDHIGCGLSDKPQEWTYRLEDHIENLNALVEALDLKNITLVVHDWGGPIGFGTALKHPERYKRLVVFNTGAWEGPIPLEIRMCRWPVVGPLTIRGLNGFVQVGLIRAIADRKVFRDGVGHGYAAPYNSWENRIATLRFIQDIPLEANHPTRQLFVENGEKIRSLNHLPMMIIWGEQDFCFVPVYRKGWIERFPAAEVHVFNDASHWVVEDAPTRIIPLMKDFFARHPTAAEPA